MGAIIFNFIDATKTITKKIQFHLTLSKKIDILFNTIFFLTWL